MNSLLIPLGIASVPLGFVFYQLYYWIYWDFPVPSVFNPISSRKIIDPVDRGQEILRDVRDKVDFKIIFENAILKTNPTPFKKWKWFIYLKSRSVMYEYRQNWHLSDSAWYLALSDERYKNTVELLERRNQMLSDIYHSLGACYQALVLSYFLYLIAAGWIAVIDFRTFIAAQKILFSSATVLIVIWEIILRLISLGINTTLFYLAFTMFKGGRIASFDALLTLKHDVITNVLLNKPFKGDDIISSASVTSKID
jgi:hypothetical protein